ncbi:MAG: hypothetical protein IPN40_07770 [Uliginosibacterium sp.]|nr:hypothetical protein [Uliginosibacterium sp.]
MGTRLTDLEQYDGRAATATERIEALSRLAQLDVDRLDPEDLRYLISQGVRLDILIPRALQTLSAQPMIKASLYPGDLLEALNAVPHAFWDTHPPLRLAWNTLRSRHAPLDE